MKVAILFGGTGSERKVSVASAQQLASQLPDAELLFWHRGGIHLVSHAQLAAHAAPFTSELAAPAAPPRFSDLHELCARLPREQALLLALHGGEGESGELQAELDRHGIAYTGSGAEASRAAYDKPSAKAVAAAHGFHVASGRVCRGDQMDELDACRAFVLEALSRGQALFAKPVAEGSSVGLLKIQAPADFERLASKLAAGDTYMVEEAVRGRELTVGVVEWQTGLSPLPCSEVIVPATHTFGYEEKYVSAAAQEITPADITPEITAAAQALALGVHRALACRGYSRTDCIWDGERAVFLEINTLPGLTHRSFITQQLAVAGLSMRDFLLRQLEIARARMPH